MGNHKSRLKRSQPRKPVQSPVQVQLPSAVISSRNFARCSENSSELVDYFTGLSSVRKSQEKIILVWLDPHIDNAVIDTRITKNMLGTLMDDDSFHFFIDTTECHEFLIERQNTIEPLFLIVSGQCSRELLSKLDQQTYKVIESIFIFCLNQQKYESDLHDSKKIIGIYTEQTKLCEAIQRQLNLMERYNLLIKFYDDTQKTTRSISNDDDSVEFFWHCMFKETLLRFPQTANAKKLLIDRCRLLYRYNPVKLKQIEEFQTTYRSVDALKWYTCGSFLYYTINQAIRTEDFDELYTFRYFIIDLCRALKENRMATTANNVFLFYRGFMVQSDRFKESQWREGNLISFNSFLSTSWQREVAECFAGVDELPDGSEYRSIVLEIEIGSSSTHQPIFADLHQFSKYPEEEEVLFDFTSIFRIQKVTFNTRQKFLSIRLVTDDEWQKSMNQIYTSFSNFQNKMPHELAYVIDLSNAGEYKKAYRFSLLLIKSNENQSIMHFMYPVIHSFTCALNGDNRSLEYLSQAYRTISSLNTFSITDQWTIQRLWPELWALIQISHRLIASQFMLWIGTELFDRGEWNVAMTTTLDGCQTLRQITSSIISTEYLKEIDRLIDCLQAKDIFSYMKQVNDSFHIFDSSETFYSSFFNKQLPNDVQEEMCQIMKLYPYDPHIDRLLHVSGNFAWLARYALEQGDYSNALTYLKATSDQAINIKVGHSHIQCYIQLNFVSVYLHMHDHTKSFEHLQQAITIVDKNKSYACPNIRACCYILEGLINLLDGKPKEAFTQIFRARNTHLEANNCMDLLSTTLTLWNICHVHDVHTLSFSRRNRLERYMQKCFEIFELDKRLCGGSNDNHYRSLLTYAERVGKNRNSSKEVSL